MQESTKKTKGHVVLYEDGGLFGNSHSAFLYKKVEKIVMAIYMISEFFSIQEPLKWNMRQVANRVIKDMLVLTKKPSSDTSKTLKGVHRSLLELSSYLSLGHATGLISSMNFNILNQEILKVSESLENEVKRHPDIKETIRQEFFEVETEVRNPNKGHVSHIKDAGRVVETGARAQSDTVSTSSSESVKRNETTQSDRKKSSDSTVSNKGRQEKILDVLKEKGRVSIRDIVNQIPGCSSKTIQRDLIRLIQEGLVSKEGDRRWSEYFLRP